MENSKFTPKGEDEIRQSIIEELDIEESDDNKPIIDKMVKRELDYQNQLADNHKKLSKAIEQKIKIREELKKFNTDDDDDKGDGDDKSKSDKDDKTQIDTSNFVTKDDLKNLNHRNQYSHLKDDEYEAIKAIANSTGKTFEETMESNPVAKTYIETSKANERISGAIKQPSNRTSNEEDNKASDEFDRDLPVGFSSKR